MNTLTAKEQLRRATKAYEKLEKVVINGEVDKLPQALTEMLANEPRKTSALHMWRRILSRKIMFHDDDHARAKMFSELLTHCPEIPELAWAMQDAVDAQSPGCVEVLLEKGAPLIPIQCASGDLNDLSYELCASVRRGVWLHLDKICPDLFVRPQIEEALEEAFNSSDVMNSLNYKKGIGFFQPDFIEKIALLNGIEKIKPFVLGSIRCFFMTDSMLDVAPIWIAGMAKSVEKGLFSWEELRGSMAHFKDGVVERLIVEHERDTLQRETKAPISAKKRVNRL